MGQSHTSTKSTDQKAQRIKTQLIQKPKENRKNAKKTIEISIHFNHSEQTNKGTEMETQTGETKEQQAQRRRTDIIDDRSRSSNTKIE